MNTASISLSSPNGNGRDKWPARKRHHRKPGKVSEGTMGVFIYFLRHGGPEASRTGTYCGVLDVELTANGYRMAEDFAVTYRDIPWAAVYSSPRRRTIDTARPLCEAIHMDMRIRDGLAEIVYGRWEGKSPPEVDREYHDDYVRWLADPGWNAPTEGERGIDIAHRSGSVLREIEETFHEGNVLIVSHKATIRIMLCQLLGIDEGTISATA